MNETFEEKNDSINDYKNEENLKNNKKKETKNKNQMKTSASCECVWWIVMYFNDIILSDEINAVNSTMIQKKKNYFKNDKDHKRF